MARTRGRMIGNQDRGLGRNRGRARGRGRDVQSDCVRLVEIAAVPVRS